MFRSLVLSFFACLPIVAQAADPIKGIGPVGKVELVKDNFQFLEGPREPPMDLCISPTFQRRRFII